MRAARDPEISWVKALKAPPSLNIDTKCDRSRGSLCPGLTPESTNRKTLSPHHTDGAQRSHSARVGGPKEPVTGGKYIL